MGHPLLPPQKDQHHKVLWEWLRQDTCKFPVVQWCSSGGILSDRSGSTVATQGDCNDVQILATQSQDYSNL